MALELLRAFGDVYELPVQLIKEDELGSAEIEKIKTDVFMNDAFRFGTNPSFTDTVSGRFAWGGVEVRYSSEGGVITNAEVFSDALDTEAIDALRAYLPGKDINTLKKIKPDENNKILTDTVGLF